MKIEYVINEVYSLKIDLEKSYLDGGFSLFHGYADAQAGPISRSWCRGSAMQLYEVQQQSGRRRELCFSTSRVCLLQLNCGDRALSCLSTESNFFTIA